MEKSVIIISMPKNSTKQDILDMRNKYKDKYKVHIIISGQENPQKNIQNFLISRLAK
jgi:hypothetical protein